MLIFLHPANEINDFMCFVFKVLTIKMYNNKTHYMVSFILKLIIRDLYTLKEKYPTKEKKKNPKANRTTIHH